MARPRTRIVAVLALLLACRSRENGASEPLDAQVAPALAPSPSTSASAQSSAPSAAAPLALSPLTCPPDMALVPGGTFTMGGLQVADSESYEPLPPRTVTVARFCLDRTEVTTGAYKACASCTRSHVAYDLAQWHRQNPGTPPPAEPQGREDYCNQHKDGRDAHPINCVTWNQAVAYCAALDRRLPTQEEWEYAARGGSEERKYPWGSEVPSWVEPTRLCWSRWHDYNHLRIPEDQQGTCPVKSYAAGAFGLFDMAGNVSEWTSTRPVCSSSDVILDNCNDPYVVRGSDWTSYSPEGVGGTRWSHAPRVGSGPTMGFRCAKG